MAVPRLLRVKIPGFTKLNTAFEQWANWIEYAVAVRGQWPVMVDRTPTGNLIKITEIEIPRIMVVTEDIEAMVGDDTGEGQAVDAVFDQTTNKLTTGTDATETVRNYHEKAFLTGGIILAVPKFGTLWAVDVNRCDKYN